MRVHNVKQTECRRKGDTEWNLNRLKEDTAAVKRTKNIPTNFRAEKEDTFFISLRVLRKMGFLSHVARMRYVGNAR